MIPAHEVLITPERAMKIIGCCRRTLYSWSTHGWRGIRLECQRYGNIWRTSEEALARFAARREGQPMPKVVDRVKRAEVSRRLKEAGLK